MRNTFVAELEKLAAENSSLILLVGDIGFGVFENFSKKYPSQYINMGIAEQNMISVASGLAKEGYKPIVYTIIPFLTMRAFEQIRVDICMHNRDVKLVGVGGGYSYDILGPTHHALEDIGIMRTLPGMNILTPSTPRQIIGFLENEFQKPGPCYLRLGKNGEPDFPENLDAIDVESGIAVHGLGKSIVIITHGPIISEVMIAAEQLTKLGYSPTLISIFRNEPFDFSNLLKFENLEKLFVVVEENYEVGSLYSALTNYLAQNNLKFDVLGIHPKKEFYTRVAKKIEILADLGLDASAIVQKVIANLNFRARIK